MPRRSSPRRDDGYVYLPLYECRERVGNTTRRYHIFLPYVKRAALLATALRACYTGERRAIRARRTEGAQCEHLSGPAKRTETAEGNANHAKNVRFV